ncbi:MAG: hypothetical protein NPIRA03_21840 [Nitrospirales bacterium]|nr:MAG: hypothetical protein NPIRA03_21840 [Nitrospirales bacterium]
MLGVVLKSKRGKKCGLGVGSDLSMNHDPYMASMDVAAFNGRDSRDDTDASILGDEFRKELITTGLLIGLNGSSLSLLDQRIKTVNM